ncbi:MAG TPA: translation factor GTPase family protein [Acidimicrobiales bacterium]|nr:translation factor GTPase family protein [Acidimicrobiales bacterium]
MNLGILAHVDAGKTTLTERLLYEAGAIDAIGSVDEGSTQTDTLALERQRGITIRAAVVAFTIGDLTVNIIDTPGHPDFIAEVERSLAVLDAAVLVLSAVEGVQAQTVVLMRALQRLEVPTLLFVNKVDRAGADPERVISAIRDRLTRDAFEPSDFGPDLTSDLVNETASARAHPVYVGSAITGAGIAALMTGIATFLPNAGRDEDAPASAAVFKIERSARGEKIAYVRVFSGALRVRDHLRLGDGRDGTITALAVFEHGAATQRPVVAAGQIARLSGLRDVQVGDTIGDIARRVTRAGFAPPTMQAAVAPRDPARRAELHVALTRLAEQDPLIDLRQDDAHGEAHISFYGEVQKEVIAQTVAADHDIEIVFSDTTTICIERLVGVGRAVLRLGDPANRYLATVGLRVEPGEVDCGTTLDLDVDLVTIPLYIYKTVEAFRESMCDYARAELRRGLSGWVVPDSRITMTDCGYDSPSSTARDFRKLTSVVLRSALQVAGTVVCEPIDRFRLDAPADSLAGVLQLLARLRAVPDPPEIEGRWLRLEGRVPTAEVQRLRQRLPGMTHGEGVLEVEFDRYEPR